MIGGNKSLLFNAEYYFNIASPVRILAFFDAGQVRDFGEKFLWKESITTKVFPDQPLLLGPIGLGAS